MGKNILKENNNMQIYEGFFNKWILPFVSVMAVSAFPALFMYFQNADEAKFAEVVAPLLIFIVAGTVLYFLFLIISRNTSKSAVIASMFMLVLLNYSLLESGIQLILPFFRYWHILLIFLFIMAHMVWFICKKMTKEYASTITLVMCIVFCGLILFNVVTAVPTIINKITISKKVKEPNIKEIKAVVGDNNLPNIYFLLFDEYSSVDFMKKYYDYDNSEFTDYLEGRGFNVSYTSHNESIISSTIITNYVNLDYVVTNYSSETEKKDIRHNNMLFKLLRENNYFITGAGDSDFFNLKNAAGNSDYISKTAGGDTLESLAWGGTAIYPFISKSYSENARLILNSIDYIKKLDYSQNSNQFTLLYSTSSHTPFTFNEKGDILLSGFTNWKDKKYYLGTYIYTTRLITDIVDSILEKDPNCIIVLQSDHCARASTDVDLFMKMFELDDMENNFNAVYYNGESINISGLSGVNTWRIVINKLLDKNYNIVEVPVDEYKYK